MIFPISRLLYLEVFVFPLFFCFFFSMAWCLSILCVALNRHTQTLIWSSIHNLFNTTSSYFHVAVSKNRGAVLKLFNRSHKSKKTRQNSAASLPRSDLFTQRISGFSDARFLCCHLVEIGDVITPRKITLFKHQSWTEQRIRCRQKYRSFEDICFSLGRKNAN